MKLLTQHNLFLFLFLACCILACHEKQSHYSKIEPAHLEHLDGTTLTKLILTERAVARLAIKTTPVVEEMEVAASQKTVPYSAILYDIYGKHWVYKNPEPLVYVRQEVVVDYIAGDKAVLKEGPPKGTVVVSQGAAELFGTEHEVGH